MPWFIASRGKIGESRARALQKVYDPDLKTEILLYGDDEAIRHLRVLMHTDDDATANACVDRNIQQWVVCHERRVSCLRRATVREMKEGPSGSAIRSLIPSHHERLWSKATVVSVAETSGR